MKAYTLTEVLEDEKNHPAGTFYKWATGDQTVKMVVAGNADDYSRVLIEYNGPEKFDLSFVYTMHDIGRDDLNHIKFKKVEKEETKKSEEPEESDSTCIQLLKRMFGEDGQKQAYLIWQSGFIMVTQLTYAAETDVVFINHESIEDHRKQEHRWSNSLFTPFEEANKF